ncbi:MAG TPA: ferric reductase-like transmembrane domain-containing protein [Chloroflexota bacterium]|nr:ferric reductase-like transmembrane domain-containing protein [Chloroflexota bacterium]
MPVSAAYWGNVLGLVGYAVGVAALVGGALLSGRLGARWAGRRWLFDSHQWLSWALVALAVAHGALLWPRRGPGAGLAWWWPVAVEGVPFAIAVGPFVVYTLAIVTASYYARRRVGYPRWRWLHALAYPATAVALWHGVAAGPDAWHPVLRVGYSAALAAAALGVAIRGGSYLRRVAVRRARRTRLS